MNIFFLFLIFFYIGLFAIGGGLVAATFMQQILVTKYALITNDKFYQMLAISESTPGPIGINLATYIGNTFYGPIGGIIATFGEILPSLIVIIIIAKFFSKYHEKLLVRSMFSILRPATSGLVLVAMAQVYKIALININNFDGNHKFIDLFPWPSLAFFAVCLIILFKTKIHPVFIVAMGALFGIVFL